MQQTQTQLNPLEAYTLAHTSKITIPDDITQRAAREALLGMATALFAYNKSSKAHKLYKQLKKIIPTLGSPSVLEFEPALVYLGFTGMQYFSREELTGFFRDRDLSVLFEDYDLVDVPGRFKSMLSLIPLEERDAWRKAVWEAWRQNAQPFVGNSSFQEWLKEYDAAIGLGVAETYKRAEFESGLAVQKHLNDREKKLVHRMLDLYEYIKLSSESPAGYEEDVVITGKDGESVLYTTNSDASIAGTTGTIRKQSAIGVEAAGELGGVAEVVVYQFDRVRNERDRLLASGTGTLQSATSTLTKSLTPIQANQALASLLLLAQLRKLDDLLAEEERFRKMVVDDLKKQGRDDSISGIRANPTAPQYLARLLKVILEDKLSLSHQDAIAFGTRLSKILAMEGEKYQSIIKNNKWNL